MFKKLSALSILLAVVIMPAIASAHVVVKPEQVGIGAFQTFMTGVPNEKDIPVTGLKLSIPAGLNYVTPNVKPGWDVNVVKSGDTVTEIDWTNGSIPAGQRDEFDFSAQAPAKATAIQWKAYQTYADGSVVAWDQTPNGKDDESATPYSVTKVVDDLSPKATTAIPTTTKSNNTLPVALSVLAIILSAIGLLKPKKS